MNFDWDDANRKHVARHAIGQEEAEDALLIEPSEFELQDHDREDRGLCFGRSRRGRLLTVFYTVRRGKTRVVTAYDMTKEQQLLYFEGQ
ncbi:MAG: BrnT family toxin [Acidobacteriia bacterium]|nr:BrnT family toxin [Terriglobia bacterium]